nr:MAG TPA: LAGLIDADG DNA endonuclease family [Caudoviricetes sp.]
MYKDFFENIDTEEKAYWLGFIAADGCVAKHMRSCTIELARRDREHLIKFEKVFGGYYKVKDYDREFPSSAITISSVKCCYDLLKYGITPAKSLTLDVDFSLIEKSLIRHFIRGYFDGNGSIYCNYPNRKNGYNYEEWGCNLVGAKSIISSIANFFYPKRIPRQKEGCYQIDYNGTTTAYDVLSKLYEDCTIFLQRKKDLYDEFRSSQRLSKLVSRRNYFAEEKNTSILVGFILGGACIQNLKAISTNKNRDKLLFIKSFFDEYGYKSEIREIMQHNAKSYEMTVDISKDVAEHYKHLFYPNGNKTVTRHLLNELNNDAITIWFKLKGVEKDGGLSLATLRYTKEENEIMKKYFETVHKIDVRLRRQKDQFHIHFPKKSKEYFFTKVCVPRGI